MKFIKEMEHLAPSLTGKAILGEHIPRAEGELTGGTYPPRPKAEVDEVELNAGWRLARLKREEGIGKREQGRV